MKNIFVLLLVFSAMLIACSEDSRLVVKTDSLSPGSVSNVVVRNIPGGAILKYDLPKDEDLLYVKALYSLHDGVQNEVRSSSFVDSLVIQGFGTEDTREVEIVAVDQSRNESEPVKISIKPLEAPVMTIGKSLNLIADFGGVQASWNNETRADISVVLEVKDDYGEYVQQDVYYSSVEYGNATTRGMDTIPKDFRIFVQDRWGNKSDVVEKKLTPLFEEKFDRFKFSPLLLEGDEPDAWGWIMPNLWDGKITEPGFHTANGAGRWPHIFTMDIGQVGKISRIKMWQRWEYDFLFRHGNIKRFEVYGTTDAEHLNDWSVWTKIMDCEGVKPSGLPVGEYSAEDLAYAKAGEEFICSPDMPAVRFLRFKVTENWSGGDFIHFNELEIYGQVEK